MSTERESLAHRLELMHELHFELAEAEDIDELCRTAVDRGRSIVGLDRIGVWFLDDNDPNWFRGSFGIDEKGEVRDEREACVPRDWSIYDVQFFRREVTYRRWERTPIYDERHNIVGHGELIVTPIWNGKSSVGALAADNFITQRPATEDDCQMMVLLARMIGHLCTIKQTERQLREKALELEQLATTDGLTGLLNRNAGIRILHHHITLACRTGKPVAISFIDLDGLKQVNDQQGHKRGDLFIRAMTQLIERSKRLSDAACRMGGDEFMIVLPNSATVDARRMMDRLEELVADSPELHSLGFGSRYSYGIADFNPKVARDSCANVDAAVEALIHRADLRMYEHKRAQGRTRN